MFNQLIAWDNLLLAYRRASRGKRSHPNVAAFEYRLEDNLWQLQTELQQQQYTSGFYHSFFIHDPKRRLISAAPFRDRVVHHALCNLLEPQFDRGFIEDSYANRLGKGTHRARARAQHFSRRFPYVLQLDVRQFFPSVDHAILRGLLAQKVSDERVLWLVDVILQGGENVLKDEYDMVYFPGDDLLAALRPRGLPIGNLTSQFWGNVYLNRLDQFVKRRLGCKGYVRYVDDLLLFADDKSTLWRWKEAVTGQLAILRLTAHPGVQPRPVSEGIPFLGFHIFPDRMRLKRRKGIAYRRKFQRLLRQYAAGEIGLEQVDVSVRGWLNHARFGNTVGLRKALLTREIIRPP
ncbi:MAG: group II intron reverse transcriptase domain-containing protein [Anaerolineales bacterium]|nr:group II intron reverse transcriptase domain-containing protein [Anaerolineales bacterium]